MVALITISRSAVITIGALTVIALIVIAALILVSARVSMGKSINGDPIYNSEISSPHYQTPSEPPRGHDTNFGFAQHDRSNLFLRNRSEVPQPLSMDVGIATDVGKHRTNEVNEDSMYLARGVRIVDGHPQVFALMMLSDGMGGHTSGWEASALTVSFVSSTVLSALTESYPLSGVDIRHRLREGVLRANEALYARNITDGRDMGATITAAVLLDNTLYVAHVGDARMYLSAPDLGLHTVTTDHASETFVQSVNSVQTSAAPQRNRAVYRSLGGNEADAEPDMSEVVLRPGDRLLMCTDGLWSAIPHHQLRALLTLPSSAAEIAETLVNTANVLDGHDNISAIVAVLKAAENLPANPHVEILAIPEPHYHH